MGGERSKTAENHKLGTFNLTGIPPAPRGVPQIEVTFDLDANGILNVSAEDKKTGNKNKITITNDQGRLSAEEIEQMVKDAERYAEEDKKHMDKVNSKNGLEGYCYSLKNTINDEKVKDKIDEADRKSIEDKASEIITWIEDNEHAEVEEFEEKEKELEGIANPIMTKMYSDAGGAGGMPGGMPGGMGGMPGGMPGGMGGMPGGFPGADMGGADA